MKYIILTVLSGLFAVTSVLADGVEEEAVKPKSKLEKEHIAALKSFVAKSNKQLSQDSPRILLLAQLADKEKSEKEGYLVPSDKVVKVANAKSWPDLTVTSFIILMRDNGTIAAFQEVPSSESGDWFNTYTHYYDESGNTISYQRYSGFFNGCPSSPAKEISTYYFQSHRLIAKDYVLVGDNDKAMKPSECEFPYRHKYTIQKTWNESKAAAGIGRVLGH